MRARAVALSILTVLMVPAAVIQAGAEWELRTVNTLDDGAKATPAIPGGKLYVRTYSALYCFASKE